MKLIFTKLINLLSLEPSHHKLMIMCSGGIVDCLNMVQIIKGTTGVVLDAKRKNAIFLHF